METKSWSNWSGRVRCSPQRIATPSSVEELQRIVRDSPAPIRVVGSGHSFTDLVATNGTLISLDNLQGIVEVDRERCEATVYAGTKLWRLNELLDAQGLAMENLGDINVQSVAGAVGTGTHGTGTRFGSLSTFLIGITLVTANGALLECSETENADVFKAAQVSIGSIGVMAKVRLRLVPSYRLRVITEMLPTEEILARADEFNRDCRHFEFFPFPNTDLAMLKRITTTTDAPTGRPIIRWMNEVALENAAFGAFCWLGRMNPAWSAGLSRTLAKLASRNEMVDTSHRVLCTQRLVHFNEMEYAVPVEHGPMVIRELVELIVRDRIAVVFPLEYRFVKADDIPLSTFYGRDSVTISLHQYRGIDYAPLFDSSERIFMKYKGRPHWGKLHSLTVNDFAGLYPKWNDFQSIRDRLDPQGHFLSPYLKMLLRSS